MALRSPEDHWRVLQAGVLAAGVQVTIGEGEAARVLRGECLPKFRPGCRDVLEGFVEDRVIRGVVAARRGEAVDVVPVHFVVGWVSALPPHTIVYGGLNSGTRACRPAIHRSTYTCRGSVTMLVQSRSTRQGRAFALPRIP